jgi:hypothetical protein
VFPPLCSVICCEFVVPSATFPNATLVGFAEICPCVLVPVPVRATLSVELVASLAMERLPVAAVADVGANCTCTMALCPTAKALVGFPPTTANAPPVMLAPDIVAVPVPVFVIVTLCVDVLPTGTLPKPMLAGDGVRTPPPEVPTLVPVLVEAFVV